MKFHRGAWLTLPGVQLTPAQRLYDHAFDADAGVLRLQTLDRGGEHGDVFEGTVLRVEISAPLPGAFRVRVLHHRPGHETDDGNRVRDEAGRVRRFDLDYTLRDRGLRFEETDDALRLHSGKATLRIAKSGDWALDLEQHADAATRLVTRSAGLALAKLDAGFRGGIIDDFTNAAPPDHDGGHSGGGEFDGAKRIVQRLALGVGETLYGFGERFGPLVKNGQSVVVWNEDPGTNSEWAYKNIPFYLSSAGYGLLVNSPARVEFEVATERVDQVQFSAPGDELDFYLFHGPTPKETLDKYTRLSGRPPVPPAWAGGLWLSTSFTTSYNEATVNEFIDGMADRGIPLSVFHFDCYWMRERHWCDFAWNPETFPEPERMLARIKARGLKVCVWINPYISGLASIFEEGRRGGYFLKTPDGRVYQRDQWQPGMALVDFTNPQAVAWYQSKLQALLDMGVDCFKTDFGERIPDRGVAYHDGSDPRVMHNYYAHLYNQAVFELLERHHTRAGRPGEAVVFARAATAGAQRFPVHWGGDCWATFESMAEDLRGGLSFCMSGPAYWSHDIGGFCGKADPAVFKRWLQFGMLSTHSRLHGSESYRVPWHYDEESVEVTRRFTRLKNSLFPYLFAAAHDAHEHGWPVLRAMFVEFPDDPACRHLDRQYMLGPSLLVAPIFNADHTAEYYLPAAGPGAWTDLATNDTASPGQWQRGTFDFMHMPLYVRDHTLLPIADNDDAPAWSLRDALTLHAFELAEGRDASARAVSTDHQTARFTARRGGNRYTFESNAAARHVRVLLRNRHGTCEIGNGRLVEDTEQGLLVEWLQNDQPLTIALTPSPTPRRVTQPAKPADPDDPARRAPRHTPATLR